MDYTLGVDIGGTNDDKNIVVFTRRYGNITEILDIRTITPGSRGEPWLKRTTKRQRWLKNHFHRKAVKSSRIYFRGL